MDTTAQGILGVQLTLIGLYLVAYFNELSSFPEVGLLLGLGGTAVTMDAVFNKSWKNDR